MRSRRAVGAVEAVVVVVELLDDLFPVRAEAAVAAAELRAGIPVVAVSAAGAPGEAAVGRAGDDLVAVLANVVLFAAHCRCVFGDARRGFASLLVAADVESVGGLAG